MFGMPHNPFASARDKPSDEKKPVALQPHELSHAAKLTADKRLVGRVVGLEETESVFTCYLVCGPTRKQVIQIEAWRELKAPAKQLLHENDLVSLTNVSLSSRKNEKMKYNYSGIQLFVRFDRHLKVDVVNADAKQAVSGYPDMILEDLSKRVPLTSFSAANCLRDGVVNIQGRVIQKQPTSATRGPKNLVKAILEERDAAGELWQAELLGFEEHGDAVESLEINRCYDFLGLSLSQANEKNSFSFRWVKGSRKILLEESLGSSSVTGASEAKVHRLSTRPLNSNQGLTSSRAVFVSASTLASILPSSGCRTFDNSQVWEMPWVTITDVHRNKAPEWHYLGCATCFRGSCSEHGDSQRPCYAVEIQWIDHTAMLEGKIFTSAMDELLSAAGHAQATLLSLDDQVLILEKIRGMNFSIRCAIMEDEAYMNRPKRNVLHVIRIRQQDKEWTGTAKPLMTLPALDGKAGIPACLVSEIVVDAADQIKGYDGNILDCVELLIRLASGKKPRHDRRDDEAGLRLVVDGFDAAATEDVPVVLIWTVSIDDMISLAQELAVVNTTLRVIVRPCVHKQTIQSWQVLHHSSAVSKEAWLARLQWQRQPWQDPSSKRKVCVPELATQTPNSKVRNIRDSLASPSYTAN